MKKDPPNRYRGAVPGNGDSARLRRLRERRDRQSPPAPDEHNKAGDHIGHVPHPARITGGEEGVAASSPPPRQSPSSVSSARHGSLKLSRVLINRGALMSAMPLIAARKRTSPEVRVVPEAALSSKAFASVC